MVGLLVCAIDELHLSGTAMCCAPRQLGNCIDADERAAALSAAGVDF